MNRIRILIFATSLLVFSPSAEAGLINSCVRTLTQLALPYAVEYHTGKTIRPLDPEADSSELILGERIGLGDRGGLYRIQKSSNITGVPPSFAGLVAKIPHTVRFSKDPKPHAQAELEMKREIHTYKLLESKWSEVERDVKFPNDPAWVKGAIPTAPIIKSFESKEGTVLIKPEIKGESLQAIYEKGKGDLSKEMKDSLREIYSTVKAISSQVKTPIEDSTGVWTEGRPFYTDINPANLVWVSNPAQMNLLGLKRPSFVFYEITPLINRMPQYLPID